MLNNNNIFTEGESGRLDQDNILYSYPETLDTEEILPPLSIKEFYRDKIIFCTGCTGFLGKVVVEKILRCIPEIKKVYLLVREKKTKDGKVIAPTERLLNEILRSPIMDKIIEENFRGDKKAFETYALTKIEGVSGDVADDNIFIGTSEEKVQQLKKEVQVIIHSAATIGFMERLDIAINLNVYGSLRCLRFAKQCENILCFTHISTAYTNSNLKSGRKIEEKFYPFKLPNNEPIEEFCERVKKLTPNEIEKVNDRILQLTKYPNTYTVTKRMAEALITKYKGNVPVAIVRPTIVGAALREPVPGWIDTVSAGGSVYLFVGLGIISLIPGNTNGISDQVPVDFVANAMIICPADVATRKTKLRVYHVGTSSANPGKWQKTVTGNLRYWHSHQPEKSVSRADFNMIYNRYLYNTQLFMRYTWLTHIYSVLAVVLQNKKHNKVAQGLQKMMSKHNMFKQSFSHFTLNEWFFDITNLEDAFSRIPKEEKDTFSLDFSLINWSTYFMYFCYGLHKYVLKENPTPPTTTDLLKSNEYNLNLFNDIEFAFSAAGQFKDSVTRDQVKQMVLQSKAVQLEIRREAEKTSKRFVEVENRALLMMDQMFADPNNYAIRAFSWILRKVWRKMYHSIIVDSDEMIKLKDLSKTSSAGTLVFIPTHRSYVDFLILSYAFFVYGIPVPHIAASEDFLNMFLVSTLFRYSGAFFARKDIASDSLYKAIFTEYVHSLLGDGNPVEFFVEGTRSRAGKTLHPKFDLLEIISNAYLDNRVENLTLVPIHIGYEKIVESESHSTELLGGKKKVESLGNLLKASSVVWNKYGDIHVKVAEPISLKDYVEQLKEENSSFDPFYNKEDKTELVKRLGSKITYQLNQSSVIMPTALIATILLTYREGISMDELQAKTNWLKRQIIMRGGTVHWSDQQSTSAVVTRALNLISHLITKNKHMLEPAIEAKADYKKMIELSYYKNQIIYLFYRESIVTCALHSFGAKQFIEQGVEISELKKRCEYLNNLLSEEFIFKENPFSEENYDKIIELLKERGILTTRDDKVVVPVISLENFKFFCSLLWPVIDSYWGASMSLLSLLFSGTEQETLTSSKKSVLLERSQWFIEKLYFEQKVHFYEACSLETIKNACTVFIKWGILQSTLQKVQENGKTGVEQTEEFITLLPPYTEIDQLFSFVGEIQQYRKGTSRTERSIIPPTDFLQPKL
ncbi:hypothetical protein ABK040_012444 [Willaertia magna]